MVYAKLYIITLKDVQYNISLTKERIYNDKSDNTISLM